MQNIFVQSGITGLGKFTFAIYFRNYLSIN